MMKVCVVTGGTRGIGFETVKAFLKEGYRVVLYGSRQETVQKALAELNDPNVSGKQTKLTDVEKMKEDFKAIVDEFGSLDVLINNAGISDATPFEKYSEEHFDKVMDLNIKAPFACSLAALDFMKDQGGGVILNTSSMVGTYGQPSGVAYPTSKFAVNGFTKSLARELGKYNIRVNAVAAGYRECVRIPGKRCGKIHYRSDPACGWRSDPVKQLRGGDIPPFFLRKKVEIH